MERIEDSDLSSAQVQKIALNQIDSIRKLVGQDDSPALAAVFELANLVRRMAVIQVAKLDAMQHKVEELNQELTTLREQRSDCG